MIRILIISPSTSAPHSNFPQNYRLYAIRVSLQVSEMNPLESQKKGLSDDDAAALIQRSWRRRNDALSAHARWEEAAKHAKLQVLQLLLMLI